MVFDEVMVPELKKLEDQGMLRRIVPKIVEEKNIIVDGYDYINLSSNDYLGLGQDYGVMNAFRKYVADNLPPYTSSGSPLLTGAQWGSYDLASDYVQMLFDDTKQVLFFNSGYAANSGVISALSEIKGTLIVADKLIHASVITGMTSAKGKTMRFPHNDMEALEALITRCEDEYSQILIVTEAVFSMDGDRAPLKELVTIKKRHPKVALYVDEAHSFCCFGENGRGLCYEEGVFDDIDFILCTCGKALGSEGAFILCSEIARSYFINKVRSLIFSTAISPAAFCNIGFMIHLMSKEEDRRERLKKISALVRKIAGEYCGNSTTHIIPIILGTNELALKAHEYFKDRGFYAMPIRHPTVPKGQARLRISLTAALSDEDVNKLCYTISNLKKMVRDGTLATYEPEDEE